MPKIIVTSRYLKSSSKQKSNYVKYIAVRKGAVAVKSNTPNAPVTQKQQTLIASLIKEFPDSRNSFEYSEYTANPTQQKASALISEILEHNADQTATKGELEILIGEHGTTARIIINEVHYEEELT